MPNAGCLGCSAHLNDDSIPAAVAAWNRRAAHASTTELEALRGDNEALTQALADARARTIAETQRADAAEAALRSEIRHSDSAILCLRGAMSAFYDWAPALRLVEHHKARRSAKPITMRDILESLLAETDKALDAAKSDSADQSTRLLLKLTAHALSLALGGK